MMKKFKVGLSVLLVFVLIASLAMVQMRAATEDHRAQIRTIWYGIEAETVRQFPAWYAYAAFGAHTSAFLAGQDAGMLAEEMEPADLAFREQYVQVWEKIDMMNDADLIEMLAQGTATTLFDELLSDFIVKKGSFTVVIETFLLPQVLAIGPYLAALCAAQEDNDFTALADDVFGGDYEAVRSELAGLGQWAALRALYAQLNQAWQDANTPPVTTTAPAITTTAAATTTTATTIVTTAVTTQAPTMPPLITVPVEDQPEEGPLTGLSIAGAATRNVVTGETLQLSTLPANAQVTWTSTDPAVAVVGASGLVVAHSAGVATIFAHSECGTRQATVTIAVTNPAAGETSQIRTIFGTRYESNLLNWLLFIVAFGWIWMWTT